MSAAHLKKIVLPPEHPKCNGAINDWHTIEKILGMELPPDYKELINSYGAGFFWDFLAPLNPFAPFLTGLNLLSGQTKQILTAYGAGQKSFPRYAPPFPPYPSPNGLFPWATSINGDTVFWLQEGDPSSWPCVICDSKFSDDYDVFPFCASEFLAKWLSAEIIPSAFPDLTANPPKFSTSNRS